MKKIVTMLASIVFTLSANAGDFDLYGKFQLGAWWLRTNHFYNDTMGMVIDTVTTDTSYLFGEDSIPPVVYNDWMPVGTFGAKIKADRFGGCIEFGIGRNIYDAILTGDPNLRIVQKKDGYFLSVKRWYAEWYINSLFTFLTGQDLTPTTFLQCNKVLGNEQGYNFLGCLYTDFQPMFQLTFQDQDSQFEGKIAAIKVDTTLILIQDKTEACTYVADSKIPKIEGSFKVNFDKETFGINCMIAGGFQQYSTTGFNQQLNIEEAQQTITSYLVGGDLGIRFGPVSLIYNGFHGKNIGTYGVNVGPFYGWWRESDYEYERMFFPVHAKVPPKNVNDTNIVWEVFNSSATEMALILNFKPTDFLSFDGGFGLLFGEHELDTWNKRWQECIEDVPFDSYSWYAQMQLVISEHITLAPEIGQYVFGRWRGFGKFLYWGFQVGFDF